MEIDWFTVGAQLVNFAILLGLLAKFLYRPILNAVESRQERIQQQIDAAEEAKREADARREAYRREIDAFEEERDERVRAVEQEVEQRRNELLDDVRDEVRETRQRWMRRFRGEQRQFLEAYRDRLADELFAGLREAVGELADAHLEALVVRRFADELRGLDQTARDEIIGAIEADSESEDVLAVTVETRWELAAEERDAVDAAFADLVGEPVEVRFSREPDLLAGIEFNVSGHRYGWSLRSYLEGLRSELDAVVTEHMERQGADTGEGA